MKTEYSQLKINLQVFGFSEKESDVYIALLELGKGSVSKISLKAGINRTTGYDILNSLTSKGVISISGKEPRQEYAAESPKAITQYLKRVAEQTAIHIKKSEELVPEFDILYAKKSRPKIRFYEGNDGLKNVYEDTLTSSQPIRAYATVDDMHKALQTTFLNITSVVQIKISQLGQLFQKLLFGQERKFLDIEEKREIAFVPADKYYFSPEINIYDNKVMIASWREKLGIIIESEEIADAMKKIYELAWLQAKRESSKNIE